MAYIIAIDPSLTCTAVAFGHDAEPVVQLWKPKTRGAERLAEFVRLVGAIARNKQAVAYIEGYSFASHAGRERLGELGGVIRFTLHDWHVPVVEVPPSTLKKFATGKGNASKAAMVSAVASRTGRTFDTDDQSDAFALWCLGRELHGLEHPMGQLPKTHLSALDKLKEATS